MAILEIHPGKILRHSKIAQSDPRLGDDIWLAGNPDRVYRSLKRGIITAFEPPGENTDGSITIASPYYGSITLNIAPGSLTQEAIALIYAAMEHGWPVEAFYDAMMYLTALFIYPIFAPPSFFTLEHGSFNHFSRPGHM